MKNLLSIGATILILASGAVASLAQSAESERDRLPGAWKLIELDQPDSHGNVNKVECSGLFVFTQDGHLSVQVMVHSPDVQNSSTGPEQYSQGGYEASYGSYVVDETKRMFVFHVEGALVRTLIGKNLSRRYELKGNRLIVTSSRPEEHWRVVWERY